MVGEVSLRRWGGGGSRGMRWGRGRGGVGEKEDEWGGRGGVRGGRGMVLERSKWVERGECGEVQGGVL